MPDLWRDNTDKERVRDAADIVRVVGEVVALRPKGREYVGLCPFHDDHRPSMNVVPAKQIFHCFVCGSGGDVFAFVQRFHKMDFRETLEFLAEKFGVELAPRARPGEASGGEAGGGGASRSDLLAANLAALEFFRQVLAHEAHGARAREVIARRGMSPEVVERFALGAAPDRWDGLVLRARQKRLDERLLLEAGLIKRREEAGSGDRVYDALRDRLIFPIRDQIGRVVAFGGRRLNDEDEPKYLNSPETRLFNKSATLYGLDLAARAIQHERCAIVTEGYTDVIACHQAGFAHAVATLGTALTREHAAVLRRLCDRVVLLFDGDEAGQRAADRAAEVFFAEPLDVAICDLSRYTDAKDPDELLKRDGGAATFREALGGATDLLDYRFDRLRARLSGAGLSATSRAIDEELARLVELGLGAVSPVRRGLIARRLASLTGLPEGTILRAIPAGRAPRSSPEAGDAGRDAARREFARLRGPGLAAHEHLLGCVLCDGDLWMTLSPEEQDLIAPGAYGSGVLSRVAQAVSSVAQRGEPPNVAGVLNELNDHDAHDAATALATRISSETLGDRRTLHEHWRECLRRIALGRAATEQAGAAGSPSSVDGDGARGADALSRLELKRAAHARLGGDARVLPRPRA